MAKEVLPVDIELELEVQQVVEVKAPEEPDPITF